MSRLRERFTGLREQGRTALVPYLMAGDPSAGATPALMHAMVAAGADVIELGMPFSDPVADGPVIQAACERALAGGMTLAGVLEIVRGFRRQDPDTPVVLMGYTNPVERMGYERFARAAADAGADGVLTVDLPAAEGREFLGLLRDAGLDPIFLVAPTTSPARIGEVCAAASGFVYYVSLKGVTGAASLDVDEVAHRLEPLREATDLPVGVGFGIRDADAAARVARVADAVVVGSAVVRRIADSGGDVERARTSVTALLGAMRRAIDESRTTA
ncbi:MAG TPA: tryptophan synthase subunit alpha [Gammaproteobacteria bacterium]|nr:tryptophan synthase subunit alpha [Gammaproteobacteria bacterium]